MTKERIDGVTTIHDYETIICNQCGLSSSDSTFVAGEECEKMAAKDAEKESIAFANWMNKRDEEVSSGEGEWIGQDLVRRSSAELYQLFKQSQK